MARHRNVRSMNYSDEYDGYDDVYSHSVEEDYCLSPSEKAFMYDREGAKNQIGAFIKDESGQKIPQTDNLEGHKAKLRSVLGDAVSDAEMTTALKENDLDVDKALNFLLDDRSKRKTEKKEKDDDLLRVKPALLFNIPKLNSFKIKNHVTENGPLKLNPTPQNGFTSLSDLTSKHGPSKLSTTPQKSYTSLSDLSSEHLKNLKRPFVVPNFKNNFNKKNGAPSSSSTFNKVRQDIDLTKALVKNAPSKAVVEVTKKFEYLDVHCKEDSRFKCVMDITFILNVSVDLLRNDPSTFGKILCRRYKRKHIPVIPGDYTPPCRFRFEGPSPDDKILSFL